VEEACILQVPESELQILRTEYDKIAPYVTRDGSLVRELMHPDVHGNARQSLAEALVPPGRETHLHLHRTTEEIYHVTEGSGRMIVGDREFDVRSGDTICIPPGTPHRLLNSGREPLKILCACSPPYSHADTDLIEGVRHEV
jgi:mannose-6-phosphate isomerase-like protein (cupin superfamily)